MADESTPWYERAWAAGWAPLYCTRNSSGSWVPGKGTTGSAPWPRGLTPPPRGMRYRRAVRVPAGIVVLDVDCDRPEQPEKDGFATLTRLAEQWGPLPLTARLTARGPFQRSGRYAYRLPVGVEPRDPGPGVEVLWTGYRFSWAPGDVHPTTRTPVEWIGADGNPLADWPKAQDLPELPAAWVAGLSAAPMPADRGPGRVLEHGQAVAAEQRAWEEFCGHSPRDGGLRSALLAWARLAAGRQLAAGVDAASLPAAIWEAMTEHPAWPSVDWESGPSEEVITYAVEHAHDDAPVILPKGLTRHEADGYPRKELPQPGATAAESTPPVTPMAAGARVMLRNATTYQTKRAHWLWAPDDVGRVPIGEITLVAGRGDVGKSSFTIWLTAQLSQGKLPGEYFGTAKKVAIYASEDSVEHTIKPRLIAAGADLAMVDFLVRSDGAADDLVVWDEDLADIEAALAADGQYVMLVMDPLVDAVSGDNHVAKVVRVAVNSRLRPMAARLRLAVVGLHHLSKNTANGLSACIAGSHAYRDCARAVLAFAYDGTSQTFLFAQDKNNLGVGAQSISPMTYSLIGAEVMTDEGERSSQPVWTLGTATERGVDDALDSRGRPGRGDTAKAEEELTWVADALMGGPKTTAELAEEHTRQPESGRLAWGTVKNKINRSPHFEGGQDSRPGFGSGRGPWRYWLTASGFKAYQIESLKSDLPGWKAV